MDDELIFIVSPNHQLAAGGVICLSELAVYDFLLREGQFKRSFSIVYHKNKYISSEMQKMIELCQNWQS